MRTMSLVIAVMLVTCTCTAGLCRSHRWGDCDGHHTSIFNDDGVEVEFDDGSLLIINDEEEDEVEITEEYELYVNGRHIDTSDEQRELIEEYYDRVRNITDYAAVLGLEGAKIGASGVKLGFAAIAKVVKLLREDYDEEDLEEEMEREAEKLERTAERLERKADRIEDMVDELEDLHDELRGNVPALKDLEWF
jgi:hypothetical protein